MAATLFFGAAPKTTAVMDESINDDARDDDALFGGRSEAKAVRNSRKRCALITVSIALVVILLIVSVSVALFFMPTPAAPKKNVILLISDGFGPASQTLARNFVTYRDNLPYDAMLPLDQILIGSSRTRSSDSLVTDSASGATAFSCGIKTYNAAIAVDPQERPCGTVLEAAKRRGMVTGTVATSRITHATPASFNSHVVDRNSENDIAFQQIGNTVLEFTTDVIMGGGRRHFVPMNVTGSDRDDYVDLLAMAEAKYNYNVIQTRAEFDQLPDDPSALPLLALFTMDHMSYEIDRNPALEPSLREMAEKTLELLQAAVVARDAPGFFVMIEGSRIDHAAHNGDPGAHLYEILEYNAMVQSVLDFAAHQSNTVVISVSDHECGGLTLARQVGDVADYLWYPEVLARVRNSSDVVAADLLLNAGSSDLPAYVNASLSANLGVTDLTVVELNTIVGYITANDFGANHTPQSLSYYLGQQVVSERARLGWTTSGHSAVDVNLYGYLSPGSPPSASLDVLRGNRENTEIGMYIQNYLALNLAEITTILNAAAPSTVPPAAGTQARSSADAREARNHPHKRHAL